MSLKKHDDGRRYVELELEVKATPEQVWQRIATGAGISSWFARTEVGERVGGAIVFYFDDGDDGASRGTVTAWDPPRRFAYEERDWATNAPPLATEITVEARAGGTCVMRMVHSLFATSDEWDDQLEGFEAGWPYFFEVLRLGLEHFPDRPCSTIRAVAVGTASKADTWTAITRALGVAGATAGQPVSTTGTDVPRFAGVVRQAHHDDPHDMLVKLTEPAAGAGLFGTFAWANRVTISITLYLFGDEAAAIAAREAPRWQEWLARAPFAAPVPSSTAKPADAMVTPRA